MRTVAERHPEMGLALEHRCRALGVAPTRANLDAARSPMAGCEAGRAVMTLAPLLPSPLTADDLWQAIQHIRRVTVRFHRAIGAPAPHAKGMRMPEVPDEWPADVEESPVARAAAVPLTEAEEAERAINAWSNLDQWLLAAGDAARREVRAVVIEDRAPKDPRHLFAGLVQVACEMKGVVA